MAQIGTVVLSQEIPPAVTNLSNTAAAFMVGTADWGPGAASAMNTATTTSCTSLNQIAALIGPPNGGLVQLSRSNNNATIFDSADAFYREGGSNIYFSRVLGASPTKGTLTLYDTSGTAAASTTVATLTALYYGAGSSSLNVAVASATGSVYTITVTDANSNVLVTSPTLTSSSVHSELVAWAATTPYFTAASGASQYCPGGASATALSAGSDGAPGSTSTYWSNALTSGFPNTLGPGQVMAPGQTQTNNPGIWGTLATHAQSNNRIALLDGTDKLSATAAIAELTSAASTGGLVSSLWSYAGLWAGNLTIPGITTGTAGTSSSSRTIPPSPVVAALCARADGQQNNPNLAAAGTSFPLQYVSGLSTNYTNPLTGDVATLNDHGINVFQNVYQVLQNYGFVSIQAVPTTDAIYWQLNHGRLRMALMSQAAIIGQQYVFDQIDGQGLTIGDFNSALQAMLTGYWAAGALYGQNASDAFTVNTGTSINTPSTIAAGQLWALLAVRMSPYAQLVEIVINAVSVSQSLTQVAQPAPGQ